MSSRYCEHDMVYSKLDRIDDGEEWIVLGVDGLEEDKFICIPKICLRGFMDVDNEIQKIGTQWLESGTNYRPLMYEMCMVKIENIWYRCKLFGKNRTGIMMYAVDYGAVVTVAEENIRVRIILSIILSTTSEKKTQ